LISDVAPNGATIAVWWRAFSTPATPKSTGSLDREALAISGTIRPRPTSTAGRWAKRVPLSFPNPITSILRSPLSAGPRMLMCGFTRFTGTMWSASGACRSTSARMISACTPPTF